MFKKYSAFDIIWGILLVYSVIPYVYSRVFWDRFLGVPISYLPFLFFFSWLFLIELLFSLKKGHISFFRPLVIFATFALLYLPLQFFVLFSRDASLQIDSYLLDFAMYIFYGFVVFYSTALYFYNRGNQILVCLESVTDGMLSFFFIMSLIAPLRHFLVDLASPFYNMFNPLRYRYFEVMFIIVCLALALGRYYGTGNKKYVLFFAIFGANLLLAGSRTGYVAYFFLLLYLLNREKIGFFFKPRGILLIIITFALTLLLGRETVTRRISRLAEIPVVLSLNLEESVRTDKSVRRTTMLLASVEIFKKSPLIGIGVGKENLFASYPLFFYKYSLTPARPHNFYIDVLVSTGVMGFSLIALFLYSILKRGYLRMKVDWEDRASQELVRHIFLANIAILIILFGAELETNPFVWAFWGISYVAFILIGKHSGPESILSAPGKIGNK